MSYIDTKGEFMGEFVEHKEFPGYLVTKTGTVYTRHTGRIKRLKVCRFVTGYTYVRMKNKDGATKNKSIHRLVAECFIPNLENKSEVNHKNGIRQDNRVENLEWVTREENVLHAWRVLKRKPTMSGITGRFNKKSKKIYQIENGAVIGEYYGTLEAYRETHINPNHIGECCRGKRKTAGGYKWIYTER